MKIQNYCSLNYRTAAQISSSISIVLAAPQKCLRVLVMGFDMVRRFAVGSLTKIVKIFKEKELFVLTRSLSITTKNTLK
jgi:hypothetical protein